MSKRILFALVTLVGMLTLGACKKDKDSDSNASCANNTGWLRNGYQSVYVNSSPFFPADTLYATFEEVSTGVFKSTSKFDDGTVIPVTTSYLQPCNNSIYSAQTADLANKQELYRIDGNIGESWSFTSTSNQGNSVTTTTTITEKNVSKTVPAGTFSCIGFRQVSTSSGGGSATTNIFINNDAGVVLVDGTTTNYALARKNF